MVEEAAPAAVVAAAAVAPLIERIGYRSPIRELNSAEVIQKMNECVSHNKQIELEMFFTDRFDATEDMQNTIIRTSSHIKKLLMHNLCINEKNEHGRCFTYCTTIIEGIIGNGKHITYTSFNFKFELEQANQLAEVLRRSNNNNNGAIESIYFHIDSLTPVTFQPLFDALLDSCVRKIKFRSYDTSYNDNIDFTGMETKESLKELDLSDFYCMRKEDCRSLFHAMKKNKGLEKLELNYDIYWDLPEEMKRLFKEMMCENITLLDCRLHGRHRQRRRQQDRIFEMIQFHMELNRMWKRYVMKRENEKKNPAVITRIEEGENNNEEEERKKRLKMKLLLHLFMKKPVMCSTILFHLLREYPDDLVSNNNNNEHQQQNSLLLRISSSSNLTAKKKRKRTTDSDDPSDNDGVINLCASESDDGTDGTL